MSRRNFDGLKPPNPSSFGVRGGLGRKAEVQNPNRISAKCAIIGQLPLWFYIFTQANINSAKVVQQAVPVLPRPPCSLAPAPVTALRTDSIFQKKDADSQYPIVFAGGSRMDRPSRKRPHTGGEDAHSLHEVRPRPSSGFYGVYAKGKRWQARTRYDSKIHHLGTFDTKQEAALAYVCTTGRQGSAGKLNY
jgi:hypothetical protein